MVQFQADTGSRLSAFADRRAAGRFLAEYLSAYRGKGTLVLGIPRGGVPVAAEVAQALGADLDIAVARKVSLPFHPELAIGAVTANGGQFLNDDVIAELRVTAVELHAAITREQEVARQREERFRRGRPAVEITGRTVIIVDDGLATGATVRAAVRSVRKQQPARLIVAVPVGPRETVATLEAEADEVVCPWQPDPFYAVGLFYERFAPTDDEEVLEILDAYHAPSAQRTRRPS